MKLWFLLFLSALLFGRSVPQGYISPIPADTLLKPEVKVHFGTLRFDDGIPTSDSKQKITDELAYIQLSEIYFKNHEAVWLEILKNELEKLGITPNKTLAITASPITSKMIWPKLDPDTLYTVGIIDLKNAPVILELPADFNSALLLDHFGNEVASLDANDSYLLYGPNESFIPATQLLRINDTDKEFKTLQSNTYTNFLFIQSPKDTNLTTFEENLHITPTDANDSSQNSFVDISASQSILLLPKSARFFKLLDDIVQNDSLPKNKAKEIAPAGIVKNRVFQPDMHQRRLLQDAAHTAGIILQNTPALNHLDALDKPTKAKVEIVLHVDEKNSSLDGSKHYILHIPPNVPAKRWSVTLYDAQTASMLQNPLKLQPYIFSSDPNLHYNYNGSVDIHLSPKTDEEREKNTLKTVSGKNFFVIVRFYNVPKSISAEDIHILLQKLEENTDNGTDEDLPIF